MIRQQFGVRTVGSPARRRVLPSAARRYTAVDRAVEKDVVAVVFNLLLIFLSERCTYVAYRR